MSPKPTKPYIPPKPCAWHRPSDLPYSAAFEDAERRTKLGEEQTKCFACRRWFWKDEYGVRP